MNEIMNLTNGDPTLICAGAIMLFAVFILLPLAADGLSGRRNQMPHNQHGNQYGRKQITERELRELLNGKK